MKGKIGALIELGAGFNPILTGRENIYNNASILGFTKAEVDEKIQSIIDFSEIEQFIDSPVQNYSSGMKVRLGFAIASHLEPDILIIDEVLAVGDLGFVLKCFKKIDELLPKTAMIFVSHSMPMVSRICNEIILMDHGTAEYQGNNIGKGVQLYYNKFATAGENIVFDNGQFELIEKQIILKGDSVKRHENFVLKLSFKILDKNLKEVPRLYLDFKDKEQKGIAIIIIDFEKDLSIHDNIITFETEIINPLFTLGKYTADMGLSTVTENSPLLRINGAFEFFVSGDQEQWVPFELETKNNLLVH